MASPRTTCDTAVMSHFPSLLATVSVSTMVYAIHVSVAVSTLFLLLRQEVKNPHRLKHIAFIALLFAAGTANVVLYLHSTVFCDRRMREYVADNLLSSLTSCLENPPDGNATACADRAMVSYPWEYNTTQEFSGPDLTRGQDSTALFIGILAQCYLLLRCHLLLSRKLVTGSMALLLLVVLSFSIYNLVIIPNDPDLSVNATEMYHEAIGNIGGVHVTRVSWGLAIAYNLTANIIIIARLLQLRARVTSVLGRDYSKIYTGLASMVLESSALYTTVLIIAYAALPGNGGTWSLFSPLVAQTEAIAAELITLRLALGRAMTRKDVVTVTAQQLPNSKSDSEVDKLKDDSLADLTEVQAPAPSRAPRRARIRQTMQSSLSQFPSSVAAVLRSHRGDDTRTAQSISTS